MSISAIIALIKGAIDLINNIPIWISDWVKSKVDAAADKRTKDIAKAVQDAKNAKSIQEKADAACAVEKAITGKKEC